MATALIRSLSISSSFTFLLALTLTWTPTYAQNQIDNDIVIALFQTTRTVSALGTLAPSTLPADCFTIGRRTFTGIRTWFQGCDVSTRRSCCPSGYSENGYYSATECPAGYTPRPTSDTLRGTPVAFTISVDRTTDRAAYCCPTLNSGSGWQEYGFFMSDALMCDWISVDEQASSTLFNRAAASAVVVVSTIDPPASTTDSGSSTRNTETAAETGGSVVADTGSGGMSSGAIAGIAVGVGLPVLAVIGFLIYKFGGNKKDSKEEGGQNPGIEEGNQNPGVDEGSGVGGLMY
ncbi:hypothetical protein TWF730_005468 [Orbilia blumenaviensis]|uniref:Uncharacterized protein n=1 Tax=Orbilia blumenaviensis TaxID=1796055 RepID=A0AAV9VKM6_9PEZI